MTKHIEPCIICGSPVMYHIVEDVGLYGECERHRIFCNWCKTSFSNENYEDYEEETIEWFNNLHRKEK